MMIDARGEPIEEYDEGLHLPQTGGSPLFSPCFENTRL